MRLDLNAVTCSYNGKTVLNEINLAVRRGDFLGVVGPNGSGKTTLLKAISKVLKPRSGIVYLNGDNLIKINQKFVAQNMAVVPQETSINFAFTAFEIVLMGRTPHLGRFRTEKNLDMDIVKRAMEMTGTWNLAERPITDLSGGEKQRVIIAQAIAQKPRLLLLDEPTSHLDINHQLHSINLIKKLNADGTAVIAVFHDLNFAARFSDQIMIMNEGKIYAQGKPKDVITVKNLREVFQIEAHIESHPKTGELYIYPMIKKNA